MLRGDGRMDSDVLGFEEIDRTQVAVVGGKGANLGELSRLEGVRVPAGFCVTTDAFRRIVAETPSLDERLDLLSRLHPDDREEIRVRSAEIRAVLEGVAIPDDLAAAITGSLARLGEDAAYAVRSSATAEDQPTASFAGQHDTYLNVVGPAAILAHVGRCWASLFTERAVTYRLRNGVDHRTVHMAVVVQRMVFPETAGVLFTADPVTGNRKVASVEAARGLGDALVSGLVNPDTYTVRDGQVVATALATERRALSATQVVRLVELGRRIEAHFGHPQDIEWCLTDDDVWIVQSRPITTLFPIPAADDQANHVYVSVGHQQMMTDPMKPLGLSLFAVGHMVAAGGRLFVDITQQLASPTGRDVFLNVLGRFDPLIKDALTTLVERDFIELAPQDPNTNTPKAAEWAARFQTEIEDDPAIVADLIARSQAAIEALKQDIRTKSGTDLLDFILEDIRIWRQSLSEPRSFAPIMAGMNAATWINEHMMEWLGEKNAADTLALSAPNNVTSEMGLALLDVADVIRPHPEVIAYLQQAKDDGFL
ncbi:MAG TPA: PEP/pyruvate-binding domain-containing protein, partial [Actinomycetota bacterium]